MNLAHHHLSKAGKYLNVKHRDYFLVAIFSKFACPFKQRCLCYVSKVFLLFYVVARSLLIVLLRKTKSNFLSFPKTAKLLLVVTLNALFRFLAGGYEKQSFHSISKRLKNTNSTCSPYFPNYFLITEFSNCATCPAEIKNLQLFDNFPNLLCFALIFKRHVAFTFMKRCERWHHFHPQTLAELYIRRKPKTFYSILLTQFYPRQEKK